MNKVYTFLSALLLSLSNTLIAQTDFSLSALGRVVVSHDQLNGNAIEGDTVTPNRGVGGYMLFDLKPTIRMNKNIHANAILRVKNEFGSFFGATTKFEFRQFQIMGDIGKHIRYQLGDINVQMTPFTVFAIPEMYYDYESEIFATRRSIVNYENFVIGNAWRLQGGQGFANFDFKKGIENLSINAFAVRTNATDEVSIPDRVLAGTRVVVKQSDMLSFGANYVGMLDIPIQNADVNYTNNVITGDGKFTPVNNELILVEVKGEGGFSSYNYTKALENKTVAYNDYFYTGDASAAFKPAKLKVFGSYRDVGPQFSSPSAQTRRININSTPSMFGQIGGVDRTQMLFDRFTQEHIYNQAINPVLYSYLPWYNNIQPYGQATPNRRGISAGVMTDTSMKVIRGEVRVDLLSEIIGEGIVDKRKYTGIKGGLVFSLNQVLDWKKKLSINGGVRMEKTTRSGLAPVDLTSMLIDAGAVVEVAKNIDLLAGAKILNAKGNEYLSQRDEFNLLQNFPAVNVDLTQAIYSFGGRVRFANNSYFSVNYNMSGNTNNLNNVTNYNINQLFFNYTLVIP